MLHRLAKLVKIRNITKLKKFNKPTKPVNAIALHINKSKKDPTDSAVDRTLYSVKQKRRPFRSASLRRRLPTLPLSPNINTVIGVTRLDFSVRPKSGNRRGGAR